MGKDVKIGLALGLVVIVVAIVIFSVSGGKGPTTEEESAEGTSPGVGPPAGVEPDLHGAPDAPGLDQHEVEALFDPGVILGPERGGDSSAGSPGRDAAGPDARGDTGEAPRGAVTAEGADRSAETIPAGRVVHVVKPGDTLWDLARRYYGAPLLFTKIQEANRDRLPSTKTPLRIGMELVIPDAAGRRGASGSADAGGAAAASGGMRRQAAPADVEYDTYVVRPGDTLSVIAQRFYGDDRLTKPIVEANPRVAVNPDRIGVGWELRIPRPSAGQRTATRDID